MISKFNLPQIIKRCFQMEETIPKKIRETGYPFDYKLKIEAGDYPLEFKKPGESHLSKIVEGLINHSFERIFNAKPSKIIKGEYDHKIFGKKTPSVHIKVRKLTGEYSIVIKDNGQGMDSMQIKEFEKKMGGKIITRLKRFDGRLRISSGPNSNTLYHIFIPTPIENKIYY